ncbi:tumor necrosis factor receptor superfamily member 10B-like [Macaca thibetana thibetana]|uniref:tumor necrosis factor receptor superfamily member 10B-like n=1 Tax=Macaca thibetana thibetana TaxID=257877 RepID=UPI0021BC606F|nr:tumor necrosis factor receptor superfamily member 10B-like [Macaca thibetana thibetana]
MFTFLNVFLGDGFNQQPVKKLSNAVFYNFHFLCPESGRKQLTNVLAVSILHCHPCVPSASHRQDRGLALSFSGPATGPSLLCHHCPAGGSFPADSGPQQQWHSFQEEKCPAGQTNTSSCTMTGDPVCQCEEVIFCEEGTFWDRNSPEMCRKYSIGCPSEEVQVSNCMSWSDSQCVEEFGASAIVETSAAEETTTTSPGTPASAGYLLCIIVGIVVLIVFLIVWLKRP